MNLKKTILARLCAALFGLSMLTMPLRAATETGIWEDIWGNLETAQENEKDGIYLRRAGIIVGSGLAFAALCYVLWKNPTTNRLISRLFEPERSTNGQNGNYADNAPRRNNNPNAIPCRIEGVQSVRQGPGECGVYALCNANAIEECVRNSRNISSGSVQNNCRAAYNRFSNAQNVPHRRNLYGHNIIQARDTVFNNRLSAQNCAIISVHDGGIRNGSWDVNNVLNNLATRRINSAHFVTHIGPNGSNGHWVLLSVVHNGNRATIYHMDSAGSSNPGRDAQRAINYLKQRLNFA